MKQTGLTRRIDELGRVVIPKEIRRNLKIRDNDELLINVSDNNVVLSKFEKFNQDEILKLLVDAFTQEFKKDIIITSKDNVIVSTKNKYNDKELSNSIISKILKREQVIKYEPVNISIFNEVVTLSHIICPFIVDSLVAGSIMVLDKSNLDSDILPCVLLIKKIVENYLSN